MENRPRSLKTEKVKKRMGRNAFCSCLFKRLKRRIVEFYFSASIAEYNVNNAAFSRQVLDISQLKLDDSCFKVNPFMNKQITIWLSEKTL